MAHTTIATDLHLLTGAVNTGVLVSGDLALLIDCCDTVTAERLRTEFDIGHVEMILCTQHRRPNVAGAFAFSQLGAQVVAPETERPLFDTAAEHWANPNNRWHLYHHQPGQQVLDRPLSVTHGVDNDSGVSWRSHIIQAWATPGATDGSVSYEIDVDGKRIAFCGDAIYGPGQLWELHALQKGNDQIRDYHGFVGNLCKLMPSLEKLREFDLLVPSHGDPITDPEPAIDLLIDRLESLWKNYTSTSCLNHYFPHMLCENTPDGLTCSEPAINSETSEPPEHVLRPPYTSWMLRSDTGAALLIDCGHESVIEQVDAWLADGTISSLDGVWITHYHDDHIDALPDLVAKYGKNGTFPVMTVDPLRDVIECPDAWVLPCISPAATPVNALRADGESWQWNEFSLTAYHFPGQTFYHSGLFVEGHDARIFFAGDSGSPTGLDDHCAGNRNWLRPGSGFRRCLAIWRETKPDYIFNDHQPLAFRYTEAELDLMEKTLKERREIIDELTPWPDADFSTDEHWARVYPYEQYVARGESANFDVRFTNHSETVANARVSVVPPAMWRGNCAAAAGKVTIPPLTDGAVGDAFANPDGVIPVHVEVPATAPPGKFVIPVRITWERRYLGQYRHAIINVL